MHTLRYTYHALSRRAQRNLSDADIDFVLNYGRRVRSAGVLHIFLGRRDFPRQRDLVRRFGHLEGTTLVVNDQEGQPVLVTAYRNRRALKQIRAKTKYERYVCNTTVRTYQLVEVA